MQVVRRRAALLVVLPLLVTAGCAVGSTQGPADDARALADPLAQVTSAVETALLATSLLDEGRTSTTVTDTALLDQVHVLQDASDAVATLVPAPGPGSAWQSDALAAVGEAQTAVADARAWATGAGGSVDEVTAALEDAGARVDDLTATLQEAGS